MPFSKESGDLSDHYILIIICLKKKQLEKLDSDLFKEIRLNTEINLITYNLILLIYKVKNRLL